MGCKGKSLWQSEKEAEIRLGVCVLVRRPCIVRSDLLENRVEHVLVAEAGIDHHVVKRSAGPLLAEVMANE